MILYSIDYKARKKGDKNIKKLTGLIKIHKEFQTDS